VKKRKPHEGLKALRKILGKSQEQFAAMLGVSLDAIASTETGRNGYTEKMDKKIRAATGATFLTLRKGKRVPLPPGEIGSIVEYHEFAVPMGMFVAPWGHYTERHWKLYQRLFQSEKAPAARFESVKTELERLFEDAAPKGGTRNQLPAVVQSLHEWIHDTRQRLKLPSKK
jgi:transcriptional regulator with XRE-family HTH domain